jgi:hypothetical protein
MAKKLYFIINQQGKVADVMMAADEKSALQQAMKVNEDYTAELVTAKNYKRLAEQFGEVVEGDGGAELQDGMTRLFESLGLPAGQVREATRGRYLDATKTLAVLGLKPKDFSDVEMSEAELEEALDELHPEPGELTEEEAEEALQRARIKLGLKE